MAQPFLTFTDNATWAGLSTGAYCWYDNDITNKEIYGALYNWHAVNSNKLAPEGWRVPTDEDWTVLTNYLGGENVAGGKLKSTGTSLWRSPNTGATNESGFTGLPGGGRFGSDGVFGDVGNSGSWWSSEEFNTNFAWDRFLTFNDGKVFRGYFNKSFGFSVRCILGEINPPVVTTSSVMEITFESAVLGGNVISDGNATVTERGIVYGTSQNPTIANSKVVMGSGIGIFRGKITGLSQNTTYYARAYAINSQGTAYGNQQSFTTPADVTNPITGKTWMDRNLGASQVATSSTDATSYGDLYQWGRGTDGHQIRTSGTTATLSSSNTPGHGNFITIGSSPNDWRSPQNNILWQGVSGINNPCPSGYRLPTDAELDAERLSWSSNNSAGAFGSPLKLPAAGIRYANGGSLLMVGSFGYYWSSTVDGPYSRVLHFVSSYANMSSDMRAYGFSVRCIKD